MIFVTDEAGRTTYTSPGWTELTGVPTRQADGLGWLAQLHPDDRDVARVTLLQAVAEERSFSTRFRLLYADGRYVWVVAGAQPSFGPEGERFIGFLGSVTELAESHGDALQAYGQVGRFVPPPPHPHTLPSSVLELVADHLLITHALVASDGRKHLLPGIEDLLAQVGRDLANQPVASIQ